jgi:rare lipoprotein A
MFRQADFTAAHPSLPFDTYLKVTNLNNGNSVVVRINDRGPYVDERMLDLSHAAAIQIASDQTGVVPIKATIMLKN